MKPLADAEGFLARLDAVEQRLQRHAEAEAPIGLTEPDPDGTERWEAGQVWAHMAEFVSYWHAELEKVTAKYDRTPVPFGRTKADPARASAIEMGRHLPIQALMSRVDEGIAALKPYLDSLTGAQWKAVGLHSRLGEMDVAAIVQRFLLDHLEEHADQLDKLR